MAFGGKKILLLGFIVVLLVVIPLTVYLVQQQQKLKVGATPSTTIAFVPETQPVNASQPNAGDTFYFDISLNPGTNQISFVKLTINFDATKLKLVPTVNYLNNNCGTNSLCPNTAVFPSAPLQGPTPTSGSVSVTLSVGTDTSKIITQNQSSIARITFQALPQTSGTTQISFASDTQALSISSADQFNENVLASSQPATITISGTSASPSPSPSASPSGKVPVCTALNVDKQTTGAAPYAVNFTAIGGETGGTITKVTFNWGDGPSQSVTDTGNAGGGVGTAQVQTQLIHTFNNPGTFTTTATLTDSNGNVSAIGSCTQTINITASSGGTSSGSSSGGGGGGGGGSAGGNGTSQVVTVVTPSPTPTTAPATQPGTITTKGGLPATGPGDKIVSFGALGIVSTIVGALLLFGL